MRLSGRTVLVTGAARGIGEQVARAAAEKGARVALVGLEPQRLEMVGRSLPGGGHAVFPADVTDQDQLHAAVTGIVAAMGGIDVVVANAGIMPYGTVSATPIEAMVRTIDVNLSGAVRTVAATLPHVRQSKGYFLFVSSMVALAATPGTAVYGAAKAGVEQFANALRVELAPAGVGVGIAYLGRVDTDLTRDTYDEVPTLRAAMRRLGAAVPAERCAAALIAGIERRRRRIYVPRPVRSLAALRNFANGRLAQALMARYGARRTEQMDADVRKLGRSFGKHSVESEPPGQSGGR